MAITHHRGRTLDRVKIEDTRDLYHPAGPILAELPKLRKIYRAVVGRTWRLATWNPTIRVWEPVRLDQGPDGACVGFGWSHWEACSPIASPVSYTSAMDRYHRAQRADEWPGESYEGTSVRAGAKVEQDDGRLVEYVWLDSVAKITEWVRNIGPVVIGINVTDSMFDPDEKGFVVAKGADVGGHCMVIRGDAPVRGYSRVTNSWGIGWGVNGECLMTRATLENRMADDGEAVGARQVAR